jgi:predicted metalloprotease
MRRLPIIVAIILAVAGDLGSPGAARAAFDCTAFRVQEDAQAVFDANPAARLDLDPDGNGIACDDLLRRGGEAGGGGEAATPLPSGVPDGAVEATVFGVVDGATVQVRIGERDELVRLLGVNAPVSTSDRPTPCYAAQASAHAGKLLPRGRAVYLEAGAAARDGAGRVPRYAWVAGKADGKATLVNEQLLRRGDAVLADDPPAAEHADRLRRAEAAARKRKTGLWGACTRAERPNSKEVALYASSLRDPLAVDIDLFWSREFGDLDLPYDPPTAVVSMEGLTTTECGLASPDTNPAFFCPIDDTIYYAAEFRRAVEDQMGGFAWPVVLAHEWGHHVQHTIGVANGQGLDAGEGIWSIAIELQADCLAGSYVEDAEARGLLARADADALLGLVASFADPEGIAWYEAGAHGDATDRMRSFQRGYDQGVDGCELDA